MKFKTLVPVLALAAFGAACEDGDDPIVTNTATANVRFVNVVQGASGSILLTSNGTVVGQPQAFGSAMTTCAQVNAGTNRTLAFGTANSGNNGIASTLGTSTADFANNGNFTIVAMGTAASPTIRVLNNTPTTTASSGNANVRFVNATGQTVDFFTASGQTLGTATFSNVGVNSATDFTMVPIANSNLTFRAAGSTTPLFTTTLTGSNALTSGGNTTILLAPAASGTGFQTIQLSGC